MGEANQLIFIGTLLFLASILLSAGASRLGAPLLLVFLVLGMLAGEDGPGGIQFDDYRTSYIVGTLALAVILFDGGLRTTTASFRVGLKPAISLATLGVIITAAITGAFAAWILDIPWLYGMLLGAIVGSTDAAAVFSVLHSHGMELKRRVAATLEIESGSNDPMAVFLTIALIEILLQGHQRMDITLVWGFIVQMGLGTVLGLVLGWMLAWTINRLHLTAGLYPLLALAGGLFIFGLTNELGGSGFLAIYLAGLVLGNRRLHSAQSILRVHDGFAWVGQIVMFLVLGLLATPSELLPFAPAALGIALVLIFVARPIAVFVCLAPFRMPWRESLFIAWVGLRGAVPIVLAIFPLMEGVQYAGVLFDVAFFVVLVSLVLQGWTVAPLARLLKLEIPPHQEPVQRVEIDVPQHANYELVAFVVTKGVPADGLAVGGMPFVDGTKVAGVFRDNGLLGGQGLVLAPGDVVYLLTPAGRIESLSKLFATEPALGELVERKFFGDFTLNGDALCQDVTLAYGVQFPENCAGFTLSEFLSRQFKNKPVVGDRVSLDPVELVVKQTDGGSVTQVGLIFRL